MARTFQSIVLDVADDVATLTLNRPERLNSFTEAMHAEVREALEQVGGERSIRALILTGAGRGFCAGQDLTGPTQGFARIKQAIYAAEKHALDAQLDLERDLQRELGRTHDYREGVSAFMEKRAPAFRGE